MGVTTVTIHGSFSTKPLGTNGIRNGGWLRQGLRDLRLGIQLRELWLFLGWRDVQKQYSRSLLGPLWLTLSMAIMIAGLGLVYSQIFAISIRDYLPFLTVGFVVWGLISGILTTSCSGFSEAAAAIRQIKLPISVYIFQLVWKQLIVFAHNFVIFVAVAVIFGVWPGWNGLLFLPAIVLVVLNGVFAAMILAPLCARFRDIPMIVASVLQVVFFMTPIIWSARQVPDRALFMMFNPFYHFMEIVRDPLLGGTASVLNWAVVITITLFLGIAGVFFFSRFRARVPYWM